jgi:hypothetical protein
MGDNASGARLLVHFYAYLFFEDWRADVWTKRYVRVSCDHLVNQWTLHFLDAIATANHSRLLSLVFLSALHRITFVTSMKFNALQLRSYMRFGRKRKRMVTPMVSSIHFISVVATSSTNRHVLKLLKSTRTSRMFW